MDLNQLVMNYLAIDNDDRPSSFADCLEHDGVKAPPLEDSKFNIEFRRRFRMPYGEYLELLQKVQASDIWGL
jgi:hypothetical protein